MFVAFRIAPTSESLKSASPFGLCFSLLFFFHLAVKDNLIFAAVLHRKDLRDIGPALPPTLSHAMNPFSFSSFSLSLPWSFFPPPLFGFPPVFLFKRLVRGLNGFLISKMLLLLDPRPQAILDHGLIGSCHTTCCPPSSLYSPLPSIFNPLEKKVLHRVLVS